MNFEYLEQILKNNTMKIVKRLIKWNAKIIMIIIMVIQKK